MEKYDAAESWARTVATTQRATAGVTGVEVHTHILLNFAPKNTFLYNIQLKH